MAGNIDSTNYKNNVNIMSLRASGRTVHKLTNDSIDITGDGVAEGVTETITPGSGNKETVSVVKADGYQRTIVDRIFEDVVNTGTSTLLEGLNAFWGLNEVSGMRFDALGFQNLSDNNTVTSGDAKVGALAGQFTSATSEYLSRASNSTLQTNGNSFSIAGWVYIDADASMIFCSKWTTSGGKQEFTCQYSANKFRFYISSTGSNQFNVNSNETISPGEWYFVYTFYDKENELFGQSINNGTLKTSAHTVGVHSDTASFIFGVQNEGVGNNWNGRIDAFGYWNRTLTASERTALYNGGDGIEYPFA